MDKLTNSLPGWFNGWMTSEILGLAIWLPAWSCDWLLGCLAELCGEVVFCLGSLCSWVVSETRHWLAYPGLQALHQLGQLYKTFRSCSCLAEQCRILFSLCSCLSLSHLLSLSQSFKIRRQMHRGIHTHTQIDTHRHTHTHFKLFLQTWSCMQLKAQLRHKPS